MASNTRRQLEDWLKTIDVPAGARVVDVGGAQKPVRGRTRSWEAGGYEILDLPMPHEPNVNVDLPFDLNERGMNEKLAYLAGIVDGEGSISASAKSGEDQNRYPKFGLAMNDFAPFELIRELFGFEPSKQGDGLHCLHLNSARLILFLDTVLPYLRIKKHQAQYALQLAADIQAKRPVFKHAAHGGFAGSESHDPETIDWRRKVSQNIRVLNHRREYFDLAFCLEVAEYFLDPVSALEMIAALLKPGGMLYASFHFVYPHHAPVGKDCLRYTFWGVESLLREAGFKLEQVVERMPERSSILDFYGAEGMKVITDEGLMVFNRKLDDDGRNEIRAINPDAIGWLVRAVKK